MEAAQSFFQSTFFLSNWETLNSYCRSKKDGVAKNVRQLKFQHKMYFYQDMLKWFAMDNQKLASAF